MTYTAPYASMSADFGAITHALATTYPNDRFGHTQYTRDYDYSRFSYEYFIPTTDENTIHALWKTDQQRLMTQFDTKSNLAYHIPYFRKLNSSHCTTILTFDDTHVGSTSVGDFTRTLLDSSKTLTSNFDSDGSSSKGSQFGWDLLNTILGGL